MSKSDNSRDAYRDAGVDIEAGDCLNALEHWTPYHVLIKPFLVTSDLESVKNEIEEMS